MMIDTAAPKESVVTHGTTMRPSSPEGDAYYGLISGTNGTRAAQRRLESESATGTPGPFRWVRHGGGHAIGTLLVPTGEDSFVNPWDGPVSL